MSSPDLYQSFAAYNRAMNDAVYAVCAEIPDAERKADRGAFFKSVHGTLNPALVQHRRRLTDRRDPKRDTPAGLPSLTICASLYAVHTDRSEPERRCW